jgi:hypothetical protein
MSHKPTTRYFRCRNGMEMSRTSLESLQMREDSSLTLDQFIFWKGGGPPNQRHVIEGCFELEEWKDEWKSISEGKKQEITAELVELFAPGFHRDKHALVGGWLL